MIGRPFLRSDIQAAAQENTYTVNALERRVENLKHGLSGLENDPATIVRR
jgi:hypothetical protein